MSTEDRTKILALAAQLWKDPAKRSIAAKLRKIAGTR